MYSFNKLNLLDSIEIRGLKVCYNEVCQITLCNRAKILELSFYTSFHTTKQIHSLWLKTVCGLRNSCLSKSSVLNLSIGLPDPLTWGQLLTQSLHFEKHWSFFSSCHDHPKLAIIKTLCSQKLHVHVFQRAFPLNRFSLTCSTVTKTPSQTPSADGMGHVKKWRDWLPSF